MISFKQLFFSETSKDTFIVSVGTVVNVFAGGLFFVIVPRFLGPKDYGLFSTVVASGVMAASIGNFGIDTGILRFAKKDSLKANKVLSVALKSYLVIGAIIAFVGFSLSGFLANFLNHPEITNFLKIAFTASIFLLLTNFFVAGLQAKGEFAKASLVNISSNILRFFILIFAIYFYSINLYFLTALFFLVTIASVIVGRILLQFKPQKVQKKDYLEFHKYNFWIALSLILASIPFDNYFLLKFSSAEQTGFYAAPFKLFAVLYQFGGNFNRVLAPRLASFTNTKQVKEFSVKASSFPIIFILGLLLSILAAPYIVDLFFGQNYQASVSTLRGLSVGFIFFIASIIPSATILYYFGKSKVSFLITLARYCLFIILLVSLVPTFGALGAATSFALTEFIAFLMMTLYLLSKLKNGN